MAENKRNLSEKEAEKVTGGQAVDMPELPIHSVPVQPEENRKSDLDKTDADANLQP